MPDFAIRWCLMVAGMVLVLLPGTAAAQLHMCNETPELRSFAIGYKDGADWTSEGWWSVAPGECKTVRGQALRHAYFYYRATADGAFKGQGYKFCTSPDPFTIVGDSDCESRGYARDDFSQIEIGTASEFTFTLTAPAPAAASKDAQSNAAPIAPVALSQEPWGMVMYEPSDLPVAVARFGDQLGCDLGEAMPAWGGQGIGLADGSEIYLVPCHNADINVEHFVAMRPAGMTSFRLYEFESPPGDNLDNHLLISSAFFDAGTMTISGTMAYGPDGDCGLFERHQYVAQGDYFELVEQREKVACDGQYDLPESYPLRWTIDEMGG